MSIDARSSSKGRFSKKPEQVGEEVVKETGLVAHGRPVGPR
jgi:hypothetical protein